MNGATSCPDCFARIVEISRLTKLEDRARFYLAELANDKHPGMSTEAVFQILKDIVTA